MSETPSIAVALEGGLVIAVVLQGWPATLPEPRVVVVDYDTQDADDVDITSFFPSGTAPPKPSATAKPRSFSNGSPMPCPPMSFSRLWRSPTT